MIPNFQLVNAKDAKALGMTFASDESRFGSSTCISKPKPLSNFNVYIDINIKKIGVCQIYVGLLHQIFQ